MFSTIYHFPIFNNQHRGNQRYMLHGDEFNAEGIKIQGIAEILPVTLYYGERRRETPAWWATSKRWAQKQSWSFTILVVFTSSRTISISL